jgi:hypothetical protein
MTKIACAMLCAMFLVGCSDREKYRPRKLPSLHGQSRAQVVSKLGEPQRVDRFPMSQAVGEFRVKLQNTYPLSNPANAAIAIEEMTWPDGDYWITLWLHQVNGQWVVLDSCRWHKDLVF